MAEAGDNRRSGLGAVLGKELALGDWAHSTKLFLILLCHVLATLTMAQDPWFGHDLFAYNQGVYVLLIAFIVVASLSWESFVLGPPRGVHLVLQVLLLFPGTLFLGRVIGPPLEEEAAFTIGGMLAEGVGRMSEVSGLANIIPHYVQEIFRIPGAVFLLMFLCVAFACRNVRTRIGLLTLGVLLPFASVIAYDPKPGLDFFIGAGLMFLGIALQFNYYGNIVVEENVLEALKEVDEPTEFRCSAKIARKVIREGHVSEETLLSVVRREYRRESAYDPERLRLIAQTISHRLVREHNILELFGDQRGFYLRLNPRMCQLDSMLMEVSLWPRKILLTALAILWVLSPVDILPDSIPVVGVLDDAAITLLGAGQWRDTLRRKRGELPER